jgi:hypothetical protein
MFGILVDVIIYGKKKCQYWIVFDFLFISVLWYHFDVFFWYLVNDGQAIYIEEFPCKLLDQLESEYN